MADDVGLVVGIRPPPLTIRTFYPCLDVRHDHDDPAFANLDLAGVIARMRRLRSFVYEQQVMYPCVDPACNQWLRTERKPTWWTHYHTATSGES